MTKKKAKKATSKKAVPKAKAKAKAKPAKAKAKAKAKPAKASKPVAAPSIAAVRRVSNPSTELVYADAERESNARDAAQKPFRKQFEACKKLDKVAALVAKNPSTFDCVPWVAWICGGPSDGRWTGDDEKPDAKKQKLLFTILEDLIERGAELALVDSNGYQSRHALAAILENDELTVAQRVKLLALAIEHGADPCARLGYPLWGSETGPCLGYHLTYSALDIAVGSDHPEFLEAMKPHVTPGALEDAYLQHAVHLLHSFSSSKLWLDEFKADIDRAGANLDRYFTKLNSTDRGGLVHFLCEPELRAEYLDAILDRVDVNLPLPGTFSPSCSVAWGPTASVRVPAGAYPLDIVDAIIGFITRAEATNAKNPDKSFRADNAKTMRENSEQKRERLLARGAKNSDRAHVLDLPPLLAQTGEQILRLAKLVGADESQIREAMSAIDTNGMGPWGFLHEVVPPFESDLIPKIDSPALVNLLTAFTSDRWMNKVDVSDLPWKAELAIGFHKDDDAQLLAVKAGDTTQIWKLTSDDVTVVAPTVPEYLKQEIDRWQPA